MNCLRDLGAPVIFLYLELQSLMDMEKEGLSGALTEAVLPRTEGHLLPPNYPSQGKHTAPVSVKAGWLCVLAALPSLSCPQTATVGTSRPGPFPSSCGGLGQWQWPSSSMS